MAEAEEIVVTTRAADMFVPSYYKVYDRQRHLLHQFYKDGSAVLWNGSALPGHSCSEFFLKLPATDHHVSSYDAQPVMDRGQILLTVSGNVRYGEDKESKAFSQVFVLSPDPEQPQKYFIGSDHFRFV
ncbi:NTF2- export protein 2 [Geranomyces michiganensis]|nr:NTF2- export protein 2 [Geranomyces michiganensis]